MLPHEVMRLDETSGYTQAIHPSRQKKRVCYKVEGIREEERHFVVVFMYTAQLHCVPEASTIELKLRSQLVAD